MEKLNVSLLIKDAKARLTGKEVTRLAVIHAGVTVAAGLIITLLQFALSEGIGNTGGLSGMGTRSILETMQTMLQWANTVLLPFWNLGFIYACLQWARKNTPDTRDLLTGFHRVGPCLGLIFNRMILTIAVVVLCVNVGSVVYMMTPAGQQLTELSTSATSVEDLYAILDQAEGATLLSAMTPLLIICLALSAALLVPLLYRFRLAEYAIVNHHGVRALPAMLISSTLLRRRCWQLLRLDLKFWWYYGMKLLCLVLFYGDWLLPALGVELPFGDDALFLLTYVVYLAALFGVEACFRPRVETAYALFYEAAMEKGPVPKKGVAKPQNMPWNVQ